MARAGGGAHRLTVGTARAAPRPRQWSAAWVVVIAWRGASGRCLQVSLGSSRATAVRKRAITACSSAREVRWPDTIALRRVTASSMASCSRRVSASAACRAASSRRTRSCSSCRKGDPALLRHDDDAHADRRRAAAGVARLGWTATLPSSRSLPPQTSRDAGKAGACHTAFRTFVPETHYVSYVQYRTCRSGWRQGCCMLL